MGPVVVVIVSPGRDDPLGVGEAQEPVLVEALVPEAPVKALDLAVLHGTAGINEVQVHAVFERPLVQGPAGELRAVAHAESDSAVGRGPSDGPERAKRVRGHLKAMVRRKFS